MKTRLLLIIVSKAGSSDQLIVASALDLGFSSRDEIYPAGVRRALIAHKRIKKTELILDHRIIEVSRSTIDQCKRLACIAFDLSRSHEAKLRENTALHSPPED
jgi:hypothetical protein